MRLGVALPFDAAVIAEGARVAEAVGVDSGGALRAPNPGVVLPGAVIAEGARVAEAVGFDSVWALDAHNRGMMLPDPFTALGLAVAVTERVELGSCVVQVPLRSPFLLAQQVGSVAAAAGGRFLFGA